MLFSLLHRIKLYVIIRGKQSGSSRRFIPSVEYNSRVMRSSAIMQVYAQEERKADFVP